MKPSITDRAWRVLNQLLKERGVDRVSREAWRSAFGAMMRDAGLRRVASRFYDARVSLVRRGHVVQDARGFGVDTVPAEFQPRPYAAPRVPVVTGICAVCDRTRRLTRHGICWPCNTARAMLGSDAKRAARLVEWLMLG